MKLTAKSDYAVLAVVGLARHYLSGESIRIEDLAEQQGIPRTYLVQILIELKAQKLVKSVRGKSGGYLLARPPGQITLADVLRTVHGQVFDSPALSEPQCPPELRSAWTKLQKAVDDAADSITFQSLIEETSDRAKMYYI
ncbi:MAG TPA: Rrf2 family transcriptional regulator [Verrucomicrobiae bacterium]|jgi:Rrf2 family cysteine metabolism transcriptional repressor|nr:Rrf2 family transcriptional regulator [Verrucomicrobiae bacterium]